MYRWVFPIQSRLYTCSENLSMVIGRYGVLFCPLWHDQDGYWQQNGKSQSRYYPMIDYKTIYYADL